MYFITSDKLEIQNPTNAIFGGSPGERHYRAIKFSLNIFYFLVEYEEVIDGELSGFLDKIMFCDMADVLDFTHNSGLARSKISIFTMRSDNTDEEFHIDTLSEVLVGLDKYKQNGFVYICENGKRFLDGGIANNESELSDLTSIYNN